MRQPGGYLGHAKTERDGRGLGHGRNTRSISGNQFLAFESSGGESLNEVAGQCAEQEDDRQ